MSDSEPKGEIKGEINRRTFLRALGLGLGGVIGGLTGSGEPQTEPPKVELEIPSGTLTSAIDNLETIQILDEEHLSPLIDELFLQVDSSKKAPNGIYSMYLSIRNMQDRNGNHMNISYFLDGKSKSGYVWRATDPSIKENIDSTLQGLNCRPTSSAIVTIGYISDFHTSPMYPELGLTKQYQLKLALQNGSSLPEKETDTSFLLIPLGLNPTASEAAEMFISKRSYCLGRELAPNRSTLIQTRSDKNPLISYANFDNNGVAVEGQSSSADAPTELSHQFEMWENYFSPQNRELA